MRVKVGTFNLNNLFSRFNFSASINEIQDAGTDAAAMSVRYEFTGDDPVRIRQFRGALIRAKDEVDTQRIADRVLEMDVDVLAVQEVENIDILKDFNRRFLNGLYEFQMLHEGNDPRFIDVGFLSKLPVGSIASFQTAVHPDRPDEPVFGRDLLEMEILNSTGTRRILTIYNNHLKSHFVPFNQDPVEGARKANERRARQAATVARIVEARTRPDTRYIITGDMNDPPASEFLEPLTQSNLGIVDGLSNPTQTRANKPETDPADEPTTTAWTHRFKASGEPPRHELLDHIWLSPSLADRLEGAFIDRRKLHGGDGSDHDPAWVELDL